MFRLFSPLFVISLSFVWVLLFGLDVLNRHHQFRSEDSLNLKTSSLPANSLCDDCCFYATFCCASTCLRDVCVLVRTNPYAGCKRPCWAKSCFATALASIRFHQTYCYMYVVCKHAHVSPLEAYNVQHGGGRLYWQDKLVPLRTITAWPINSREECYVRMEVNSDIFWEVGSF